MWTNHKNLVFNLCIYQLHWKNVFHIISVVNLNQKRSIKPPTNQHMHSNGLWNSFDVDIFILTHKKCLVLTRLHRKTCREKHDVMICKGSNKDRLGYDNILTWNWTLISSVVVVIVVLWRNVIRLRFESKNKLPIFVLENLNGWVQKSV